MELPKLQKQENKVTKVNITSGSNKNLGQANGSSNSQIASTEDAAKEQTNTDGSGEPSADNVDAKAESQAAAN